MPQKKGKKIYIEREREQTQLHNKPTSGGWGRWNKGGAASKDATESEAFIYDLISRLVGLIKLCLRLESCKDVAAPGARVGVVH